MSKPQQERISITGDNEIRKETWRTSIAAAAMPPTTTLPPGMTEAELRLYCEDYLNARPSIRFIVGVGLGQNGRTLAIMYQNAGYVVEEEASAQKREIEVKQIQPIKQAKKITPPPQVETDQTRAFDALVFGKGKPK